MLVSTVAFITECTDDSTFRQLFRLNCLFRTRHSDVVLQQCFLPLVFVPIPVYLRSFRLSPGSVQKMTPRTLPVAGASAEQTVWSSLFQFHGLCLCAAPVVSQRSDEWKADTPIHLDPSTTPDQRFLSSLMLCSSCATRRLRVSCRLVLRDRISTPTGMRDVAHSRGSNIDDLGFTCTRYNFDVRSLGEPAQKSRSKPCSQADNFSSWLPIYSCCSLVTMALRFGHKSSGSSSFREASTVLVFKVARASKP